MMVMLQTSESRWVYSLGSYIAMGGGGEEELLERARQRPFVRHVQTCLLALEPWSLGWVPEVS